MDGRCDNHAFEAAEDICRNCGREFCNECLVYSFGPKKPPFCTACALAAAGVRKNAGRAPVKSGRELKRLARERKRAARRARKEEPALELKTMDLSPDAAGEDAPVESSVDWSAFESGTIAASR